MNELPDKKEVTARDIYGFSNLSRAEAQEAWAAISACAPEVRVRLVERMVEVAESDFEVDFGELFRLALEDECADVRRAAVEGLWEDEDVRLIPPLIARLQDVDASVRAAAATSLGRFMLLGELGKIRPQPFQQAYQALLAAYAVADEIPAVRRRVLEALAYSGEEAVARLIREAYESQDESMRLSAVFAMGRSADERWAPEALRELYHPNPAMRYEAARACGELGLENAVTTLIELVDDVDSEVQEAAIWALGQIGGEEARRTLNACARSDNEAIRAAAREALREFELLHGDIGAFLMFDFFDEDEEENEPW